MLKKLLAAVALMFVAFSVFVASRPSDFAYQRSATIAAPAAVVFAQLEDFHQWSAWSPWDKKDPSMTREFSGPPSGVGTSYHWVGNDDVGEGRMTVTSVQRDAEVVIKLEFLKPFVATNTTTFALAPAAPAGTTVSWKMTGTNGLVLKAFGLVMNTEKMVGDDFERGLAKLKLVAEAEAAKRAAPPAPAPEAPSAN